MTSRIPLIIVLAIAMVTVSLAPALATTAPAAEGDSPGAALVEHARALAEEQGYPVEDAGALKATVRVIDSRTGTLEEYDVPLAEVAGVLDAAGLDARVVSALLTGGSPEEARGGTPTVGVGHNMHAYVNLDFSSACDARAYEFTFAQALPAPLDAPLIVPNPAGAPIAAATVWGGSAFHVTGEYVGGAHVFMGMPVDVNVNTAAPPADVYVGSDTAMEAAGAGQIVEVNVPMEFFGVCFGALGLGTLLFNGMLAPS